VKHGCYELVCVPQIQTYLECRFSGFSSRSELEESKSFNIVGKVKGYLHMLGIMFLLPVLGLYPPLAEHKKLKFTPRLRYYLFELQSVGLFVIMSCTHLNIYRDEPLAIRDWGLLVWSCMLIFSQCQFITVIGLDGFIADRENLVDLVANLCAVTGFALNVCHGRDELLASLVPENCGDWPAVVPIAAAEVMSFAVLLQGLRVSRLFSLHERYGPLLLCCDYMFHDMLEWLVVATFPLLGFAGAIKVLYGEKYVPEGTAEFVCGISPDLDLNSVADTINHLIEMMLLNDGYFGCFRNSSQSVVGPLYSYLFILVTGIMLVNMLIAMMSKTFSDVTDNVAKYFLFSKTRVLCNWQSFPAVPPPFNVFSFPYYLILLILHTFVYVGTQLHTLEEQTHLNDAFHGIKLTLSGAKSHSPHSTDLDRAMNEGSREAKLEATTVRLDFPQRRLSIVQRALHAHRGKHKLSNLGHRVVVAKGLARYVSGVFHMPKHAEPSLPAEWYESLGDEPLEYLTDAIIAFRKENVISEAKADDFRHEVLNHLEAMRLELATRGSSSDDTMQSGGAPRKKVATNRKWSKPKPAGYESLGAETRVLTTQLCAASNFLTNAVAMGGAGGAGVAGVAANVAANVAGQRRGQFCGSCQGKHPVAMARAGPQKLMIASEKLSSAAATAAERPVAMARVLERELRS